MRTFGLILVFIFFSGVAVGNCDDMRIALQEAETEAFYLQQAFRDLFGGPMDRENEIALAREIDELYEWWSEANHTYQHQCL